MRLTRIAIQNLRCVDKLELFPKGYTSLIGPNNAGKSSTLRAIELLLNQEAPSVDEWRVGHGDEPIVVEADFDELLEWERKTPGVSAHVYADKIQIRMTASIGKDKNGKPKVEVRWDSFKQEETIAGWPEDATLTKLSKELQDLAKTKGIDATKFKSNDGKEQLRSAIRETLPGSVTKKDAAWTDEGMSIPVALQQALPHAQVIPAIRDPVKDGEPGAGTSFGLLLKSIIMPAVSSSDEYKSLMKAVSDLERKLWGEGSQQLPAIQALADSISAKLSDLITAKVSLGMDPPDTDKFIGANTVLRLDDGTPTRIALQGHGLQRALVFAMLEVLAAQKAAHPSADGEPARCRRTVLLFEEPELFMHPHLMRRLKAVLTTIAKRPDWQVIVSTHSPFLVDVSDDRCSLVIHRRASAKVAPTVKQLKTDPLSGAGKEDERDRLRAVLDFHPTVCEAFFARNVILVEGDTEMAVLSRQDKLFDLAKVPAEVRQHTTVVSCDGKWTIIPVARLLRAFDIPLRVIHDTDKKNKTQAELDADPAHEWHANARIADAAGAVNCHAVDDTFEDALSTAAEPFKSSKDKPYRAWCRTRTLCDGKADLTHVPKLKAVLDFAFAPLA